MFSIIILLSKIITKQKIIGGVYMNNFTTNTSEMKREIVNFLKKFLKGQENQQKNLEWI